MFIFLMLFNCLSIRSLFLTTDLTNSRNLIRYSLAEGAIQNINDNPPGIGTHLAVDTVNRSVYWILFTAETSYKIYKTTYDGQTSQIGSDQVGSVTTVDIAEGDGYFYILDSMTSEVSKYNKATEILVNTISLSPGAERMIVVADQDNCAINNTCPSNSTCETIPGTIACSCDTGFTGNQTYCQGAVEKYLPMKAVRKCRSDKPWMTSKIKSLIRKRQTCMAKYGKESSSFKFWRNKVAKSIKKCKESYYKSKVRNLKVTDASKWWREDDVSNYSTGDSGIADDLLASTGEVYKFLCSLKTGKAPGPDGIPNVILKTFAFELAPVIADIYNSSLRDAYLPPLLKRATVTPLPKQSPPGSIENGIRPISLTCEIAKVMEGLTLARILPSIISHLDNKQFAMAGKSTQQAIVYILHLALEALDKGGCTLRFFFADFRKGFDLIDHKILLDKLSKLGTHNVVLGWIAAFLYKRSQFVRIGLDASTLQYINGGIPQGTKLGPILFAVMVNDLLSAWGLRAKFVDDLTALEIVPRNSPSLMNHIVADIHSFAEVNNMKLNPAKCKDMIVNFLHFNTSVLQPIIIGATRVESVSSFKLLGVYVTSDLTWSVHCEYIIKKSNRRLYALRKLKRSGVAPTDILCVYCAIIRSVLEYASVVFANLPQNLSDDLERVQKRALAIIYPNCSYDDALKLAGIEPLVLRRDAACKRFVETILPGNPLYPIVHSWSAPVNHGYKLRSDNVARNIRMRTDRFQKFVTIKYAT
ncbi:RNA-directed DNA polymerase from mobile element jockey [Paramuricea clavata]|uniref:RNA-directed DNA polymerase from mobile element jockey n=1 Tax=Paramuricea clavata TaxID=317549 RepID=A0A6S7ILK6_PARCT|nr:RNA-directed DNA polymerase from mobile element jockey [Paramuricea clavata]